jgi:hypothetical protein
MSKRPNCFKLFQMKDKVRAQKGQVALIVMLVMAVGLTVGLSAAQRATTSVSVSQTEKQGSKAYSAAEAGIEMALKEGLEDYPSNPFDWEVGGIEVSYSTSDVDLTELGTIDLNQDNILQFAEEGKFKISNCSDNSVDMELLVVYLNGTIAREVVDCGTVGERAIPTGLLRIRPIGGDVSFSLSGSGIGQYFKVTSQAQADSGETRAVEVIRSGPYLPAIFNYALFSGGVVSGPSI